MIPIYGYKVKDGKIDLVAKNTAYKNEHKTKKNILNHETTLY